MQRVTCCYRQKFHKLLNGCHAAKQITIASDNDGCEILMKLTTRLHSLVGLALFLSVYLCVKNANFSKRQLNCLSGAVKFAENLNFKSAIAATAALSQEC